MKKIISALLLFFAAIAQDANGAEMSPRCEMIMGYFNAKGASASGGRVFFNNNQVVYYPVLGSVFGSVDKNVKVSLAECLSEYYGKEHVYFYDKDNGVVLSRWTSRILSFDLNKENE